MTQLINASFRLRYIPKLWQIAKVIIILKPGKPSNKIKSYRPISLLPIVSKVFEKLILKPLIVDEEIIPVHPFGFRDEHSTIN